ncbi:hypothetical protein ACQQ2N_17980 [Dokdonella sp. MW10]|uniref:hypothetical protein n=1 Tax=Dokdonella sp. MW10 TaxID=2992926 RepID=UPI003F810455
MNRIAMVTAVLAIACPAASGWAQSTLTLDDYKSLHPRLSNEERAAYDKALAEQYAVESKDWERPKGPVEGDLCTMPAPAPVNPFTISSTTVGATNNYDIGTTCGTGQTLFGGTGASLDLAYGVVTDSDCSVTVSADPTGTSWDLALYVLQAPAAACTQLPTLADAQCVTMDDDGGGNVTETVTFNAVAGTPYFVIVDGFNAAVGTFDLTITGTGCNLVPVGLQSFSVD